MVTNTKRICGGKCNLRILDAVFNDDMSGFSDSVCVCVCVCLCVHNLKVNLACDLDGIKSKTSLVVSWFQ
eukprot:SAG31_NODE_711_length_12665_cov_2.283225_8_plen_70_part_00